MKALGWERKKVRADGDHGWGYARGPQPYRRIVVTPGTDGYPASAAYEDDELGWPKFYRETRRFPRPPTVPTQKGNASRPVRRGFPGVVPLVPPLTGKG